MILFNLKSLLDFNYNFFGLALNKTNIINNELLKGWLLFFKVRNCNFNKHVN